MQDSTTTPQAVATPQPSIPSSAPVSTPVYQQAPPQTAQASPQTPTVDSTPQVAQQAAPQAVNPWQEAYNRLSENLSTQQPSQPQAAYSTPTPQIPAPAVSQAAPQGYQAAPSISGTPTSWPQATQAYSQQVAPQAVAPQQVQPQLTQEQVQSLQAEQNAPSPDAYLGNVSKESLEVLNHFGAEAPALLNRYACVVEDALLTQAKQTSETLEKVQAMQGSLDKAKKVIGAAAEDNAAYHVMLTNPEMLSSYVNEFFGPEGPYPTELARDRLAAEVAAGEQRFQPQAAPQAPAPSQAPAPQAQAPQAQAPAPQAQAQAPTQQAPEFQRPQLDMPAPGVQAGTDDFWSAFSNMSDSNPAEAWKVLTSASPDALRSKVLVSEA